EALGQGDLAGGAGLFAPEAAIDDSLLGPAAAGGGLPGGIAVLERAYAQLRVHPVQTVVEGRDACVLWSCRRVAAANGPAEGRGATYFRVDDGRIARVASFSDLRRPS